MIYRPAFSVRNQICLAHIGDIARVVVLGEQVVERLITFGPQIFRDRFVPFFAICKDGVDIEDHSTKIVKAVPYNLTNTKTAAYLAGRNNCSASLARKELCMFHSR